MGLLTFWSLLDRAAITVTAKLFKAFTWFHKAHFFLAADGSISAGWSENWLWPEGFAPLWQKTSASEAWAPRGGWWQTVLDYHKSQWAVKVYTLPRQELFAEIEGYIYNYACTFFGSMLLWLYLVLASNPNRNTNPSTDTKIVSSHSFMTWHKIVLIVNMFLKLRVWGSWLSLSGACVVWNLLFCPPQLYS